MLKSKLLVPHNVTAFQDSVFTEVIEFNKVIRVGPNQYTGVLIRRGSLDIPRGKTL